MTSMHLYFLFAFNYRKVVHEFGRLKLKQDKLLKLSTIIVHKVIPQKLMA